MNARLAERCRGRWPDIIRRLGLLSSVALAGKDSPCPICGGHDRFRFSDKGFGRWFCRGCGYGGDGLRLVQTIKGVDFFKAVEIIETVVGKVEPVEKPSVNKPREPMKPFRSAGPLTRGCIGDIYFKVCRCLDLTDIERACLRFSPSLYHWVSQSKWPAVLACVALADGTPLATHQTFLEPDGSDKAQIDKPRLFAAGGKTATGGIWFGAASPTQEFMVGEGIESTLSAMRIFDSAAGCAALSANGIRTLLLPADARRVRVFADNDLLGQGVSAAREAARRWIAEGRTVAVSIAEAVGEDANDVWRRRRG